MRHADRDDKIASADTEALLVKVAALESELNHVRKCNQDLRDTETRYEALFQHMLNGVGIYEPIRNGEDFILVDMNQAAERIEKIKKRKVLGQSISRVFPGIEAFGLLGVFRKVLQTGKPIDHPVARYKDERLEGWRDHFVYRLPSGEIVTVYSDETKRKLSASANNDLELSLKILRIAFSSRTSPANTLT